MGGYSSPYKENRMAVFIRARALQATKQKANG
jgi:hypothetical protein